MTIEPIPCSLATMIDEIAELLQAKARDKNLEFIVRYAPALPRRVVADPGRIRQILMNLLGNAIKFTAKGHVYLNIEPDEPIESKAPTAIVKFSIEDTGIGIPEEKLGTVFEKFTQADASTTRHYRRHRDWVWRFLRASQNSWAEKWASSAESALGQRSGSPCLCPSTTPILSNPIPRSSSVRFASFMWMTTPPIASSCASSSIIGTCATRLALRRRRRWT